MSEPMPNAVVHAPQEGGSMFDPEPATLCGAAGERMWTADSSAAVNCLVCREMLGLA